MPDTPVTLGLALTILTVLLTAAKLLVAVGRSRTSTETQIAVLTERVDADRAAAKERGSALAGELNERWGALHRETEMVLAMLDGLRGEVGKIAVGLNGLASRQSAETAATQERCAAHAERLGLKPMVSEIRPP